MPRATRTLTPALRARPTAASPEGRGELNKEDCMFGYYLDLAWRSLKRTPILTALMVLAIGLSIGASMAMLTVHRSVRQAAMAGGSLLVWPQRTDLQPFYADGRYTTREFFAMFGVPFIEGGGWTAADDRAGAHVVVLAEALARKLFGSADAVGKTVHMGDIDYRVVGVTTNWAPKPLFYADASASFYSDADLFFLPLSAAVDNKLQVNGNLSGWAKDMDTSNLRDPSMSWIQFWVQLDTPAQV